MARKSLLNAVRRFIRRYVVMSDDELLIVALWVLHSHCIEAFEQTPYLAVTSPERGCGKSRLLETLELLVPRPWLTGLPSEAVLFRHVHAQTPTLLLDEVDTIFNPKIADRYEGHRALLNMGHRRGAKVARCVGTKQEIVEFGVFCGKVLAGIGTLPDTVADRSVPIRLQRRKKTEPVGRFIRRDAKPHGDQLRKELEHWGEQRLDRFRQARPAMPEELSDRMIEGCEPLVAIADELGCGTRTRTALVEVLTGERLDDQETMRLRLLRDLKSIWEAREGSRDRPLRAISTRNLLKDLCAMEEAPWGSYYGHRLDPRDLASLLHHYGITPVNVRNDDRVVKGYRRDPLYEVWERYL